MEAWLASLLNALVSGVVVGLVVAVFKVSIEKNSKARETSEVARIDRVKDKVMGVYNELVVMKGAQAKFQEKVGEKFDQNQREVSNIAMNVAVLLSENKNLIARVNDQGEDLKKIKHNFGKVTVKD